MSPFLRVARVVPALALMLLLSACPGDTGTTPRTPVPARVDVSLSSSEIEYGGTSSATARVFDARGEEIPDAKVSWHSSDAQIFTVDPSGTVLATGTGLGTLRATAGTVSSELPLSIVPRILTVSAIDNEVALYETLSVGLPADFAIASEEPIAGILGTDTLWFVASPAGLDAFAIAMEPASGEMRVEIDRNHIGFLDVTITPAPALDNPEVLLEKVQTLVESHIQEINSMETTYGEVIAGKDFVEAVGAQFTAWADTASAESKMQMAQFFAANPDLLGNGSAASLTLSGADEWGTEGCVNGLASTAEGEMFLCYGTIMLGVGAVGLGGKAAERLCANPATFQWCLGSLATIAGGMMLTRHSTLKVIELKGVILNRTFTTFIKAVLGVDPSRLMGSTAANTTSGPLAMTADVRYEIGTEATYRSVVAADQGDDIPGKIVALVTLFDGHWKILTRAVRSLPSWMQSALPTLPAAVGTAPAAPRVSAIGGVPLEYLTSKNSPSGTTVLFDPDVGALQIALTEGLEQSVSFDLAYDSPVTAFNQRVTAIVRVDPEMELVAGDGQDGNENSALPQALVVQVTNNETGVGVAGVPVQWTVVTGGGTLSSPTATTNSDGRAQIGWTLGIDSTQSVSAQATYSDGTVAAGPVTFNATIGDSTALYRQAIAGSWSKKSERHPSRPPIEWDCPQVETFEMYADGTGKLLMYHTCQNSNNQLVPLSIPVTEECSPLKWSITRDSSSPRRYMLRTRVESPTCFSYFNADGHLTDYPNFVIQNDVYGGGDLLYLVTIKKD